ncbi:MAG: SAM-dependent methyltransferase [Clostridiaceae bacterium]|nr:SAM-dependent methyltransferase [Clostridiaceae bacterium]
MKVKLTPRLQKIADLITTGSRVADIGTDHGYIPIYLLQNNIANELIASDVNEGPLETAKKNIKEHGYEDKIKTRLGSGLEVLEPKEVDTVIIAGMGGILIAELLERVPEVTKATDTFILQPMQAQEELRRHLANNGFQIKKDLLVKEDRRIYEILVVEKGEQIVKDEIYYDIGFSLESNPPVLSIEFLEKKIRAEEQIITSVQNQDSPAAKEKYEESVKKLQKLQEVLVWVKK